MLIQVPDLARDICSFDDETMTPEQGKWILSFGTVAWLTHMAKAIALFVLLWRTRPGDQKGPMRLLVFLFLLTIFVLLPYQDSKASRAMNRFLLICTILQYCSWIGLAYVILMKPTL